MALNRSVPCKRRQGELTDKGSTNPEGGATLSLLFARGEERHAEHVAHILGATIGVSM